jgi:transcriptional regulator with XRE-family HTH domain
MLCQDLEALRIKANLSYKQLAQMCDVSETTINRIFSGETRDPGFSTVAAIVKACGGSLDEIGGITRHSEKADTSALKEVYEDRITCIKKEYQEQIDRLYHEKAETERHNEKRLKFVLGITALLIFALDLLGDIVAKMI